MWRLDTLPHIDIADPVAALVLGAPPPLELLLVQGRPSYEQDELVTVDEDDLGRRRAQASTALLARAGVTVMTRHPPDHPRAHRPGAPARCATTPPAASARARRVRTAR